MIYNENHLSYSELIYEMWKLSHMTNYSSKLKP